MLCDSCASKTDAKRISELSHTVAQTLQKRPATAFDPKKFVEQNGQKLLQQKLKQKAAMWGGRIGGGATSSALEAGGMWGEGMWG